MSSTAGPTPASDAELVQRLKAGDDDAFETLVRLQTMPMLRAARRIMRTEEDARDAVQDAFVAVCRSIGSFESQAQLSTWLHRIVVNACLMRLRTRRRHPEEEIETLLPKFRDDGHHLERVMPWQESAHAALERSEMRTLVRSCVDQLPETYRVVLILRDLEELTTEETAELLNITPNAVKIRLHRARQALRALLDPHMRSERR